ncbi:hypothetical protein NP493_2045g00000 [Ridgeia piscesae]|uniref:Uncharacterized protein n=1 Tax=Ridgeia piscesae TaxID=27915 RepID=A0AAD9JPI1_RIDPI|nr:hypothetical protein NP493_2045g00000 [Ridgeia piscesae]
MCVCVCVYVSAACPACQVATCTLGTGASIGIAVATFFLGIVITSVVMSSHLRMRFNNHEPNSQSHQREPPPVEMETGIPDYDHLTRVPGELDVPNVYEVLSAK